MLAFIPRADSLPFVKLATKISRQVNISLAQTKLSKKYNILIASQTTKGAKFVPP